MRKERGIILKGIGGFYYVEISNGIVCECKARGLFRKNNVKPYVGDKVIININDEGLCSIEDILPRKNELIRPPISNIDKLVIVVSVCNPIPNTVVIDKMIALSTNKKIEPIVVVTKTDLADSKNLIEMYNAVGIKVFGFSSKFPKNIDEIENVLLGNVSAFTGNSGVGKSTLLNCINKDLLLKTGEISSKLGRGKHTTRFVELYKLNDTTYVADTPGFSTVDIERYEIINKDKIQFCFREFSPHINNCKFSSCTHICEKGCAVIDAVKNGKISKSRYNSYVYMYKEVKDVKEWKKKI